MKTDDLDQLRAIAPQRHDTPPLFSTVEREALLAETFSYAVSSGARAARRPVRTWTFRLAPLATAGIAAAVVAGTTAGPALPAGHGHPSAAAGRPPAQALTVAYVTRHARAALARQQAGTLKVTITEKAGVWSDVENLGSGADRSTFRGPDGSVQADYSSAGHGRAGIFKVVDYQVRAWWTFKGSVPGPSSDFSPDLLRQQLSAGLLAKVGDDTIDGQPAVHLRAVKGKHTLDGKTYFIEPHDIWVSAATFLPIREVDSQRGVTWDLSWSAQPPTADQVTAVPPTGFKHLSGPPRSLLKVGGGQG